MMSPDDVLFKLGQLEPDEIARLMKDSGVQALRMCASDCAVTQYMYQETRLGWIRTGATTMSYAGCSGNIEQLDLPATVAQFVFNFDFGHYPELDAFAPENM